MGVGVMFGSGVAVGWVVGVLVGAGMMVSSEEKVPGCGRSGVLSKTHTKVMNSKKTARPSAPSMTPGESKRRKSKSIQCGMIPDLLETLRAKNATQDVII
ncbi:MAG TPA: hypothetical protein DCG54_02920 [Anaerolineae bacterium]|nr:hypothetical protein [Anaerolineae bacterium]